MDLLLFEIGFELVFPTIMLLVKTIFSYPFIVQENSLEASGARFSIPGYFCDPIVLHVRYMYHFILFFMSTRLHLNMSCMFYMSLTVKRILFQRVCSVFPSVQRPSISCPLFVPFYSSFSFSRFVYRFSPFGPTSTRFSFSTIGFGFFFYLYMWWHGFS